MTVTLDYTTDELARRVRRTLQLRTVNLKLTEAEILQICDEEIQHSLFPSLMRVREDYQSTSTVVLMTAGVGVYRLPQNAASSTIDHIDLVQLVGGSPVGAYRLPRLEVPSIAEFVGSTNATPRAYVLQGDTINLLPTPNVGTGSSGFVLSITHEIRPSRLVAVSSCSLVDSTAINGSNLDVTLAAPIASTMANGDPVDIVPGAPPLQTILASGTILDTTGDPVISVFSGYSLTVTLAQALIPAGSYMVPSGFTCVFPLPDAWWSASVLSCSASVARVTGNSEQSAMLRAEADAAIMRLIAFQSSRVRKQPHAVFDRSSPQRRGIGFPRRI